MLKIAIFATNMITVCSGVFNFGFVVPVYTLCIYRSQRSLADKSKTHKSTEKEKSMCIYTLLQTESKRKATSSENMNVIQAYGGETKCLCER